MNSAPHDQQLSVPESDGNQIVVGVDGTYAAGEALGWAARLARATCSGITAVHAWQPGLGDATGSSFRAATRWRTQQLRRWCELIKHVGVQIRCEVHPGEPCDVLSAMSHLPSTRLIVVGRAAREIGLVHDDDRQADRIGERAQAPLAVVPSPGGGRALDRIVVGLDGSAASEAACRWVAWLASSSGIETIAVTAFEPLVEWLPRSAPESMWAKVRAQLEGPWTAPLRAAGLHPATTVLEGSDHHHVLTRVARECHADVVAIGATTAGHHVGHAIAATRLLHHCRLPVVVVPPTFAETLPSGR